MRNTRHRPHIPQQEKRLTLILGEEKLVLNFMDLSPETIEWIIYDTGKLTERIRVAANKAREMVSAIKQ